MFGFFLKFVVQDFSVCVELSWVGGEGWGFERWGPEGVGTKISRFFFSLPPEISFLLSLGSSRGILVVFEAPGRSNVHVWSSMVVV